MKLIEDNSNPNVNLSIMYFKAILDPKLTYRVSGEIGRNCNFIKYLP